MAAAGLLRACCTTGACGGKPGQVLHTHTAHIPSSKHCSRSSCLCGRWHVAAACHPPQRRRRQQRRAHGALAAAAWGAARVCPTHGRAACGPAAAARLEWGVGCAGWCPRRAQDPAANHLLLNRPLLVEQRAPKFESGAAGSGARTKPWAVRLWRAQAPLGAGDGSPECCDVRLGVRRALPRPACAQPRQQDDEQRPAGLPHPILRACSSWQSDRYRLATPSSACESPRSRGPSQPALAWQAQDLL